MTTEEKTAYMMLSQYRIMVSRAAELEARAAKARKAKSRASPTDAEQLERTEKMYSTALIDLTKKLSEIINTINALGYEQHKRVLELRYIDGKPWAAICNRLHLSRSAVHRLHVCALKDFYACYIS